MRPDGFTLVELVMTMVVLGILAAVAIPRFFERQTYDARAFLDRTAALLRYAQKAAIAQRRTVCADFTASSATLKIRATEGDGSCDTDLAGPTGERPYVLTAPAGVSFSSFASLSFKADGSPSAGATYSVAGFPPLTVEAVTGYVH
ncbi:MAG: prepilin-type N-terminal cleavage/methylation domain-containing protein [Rhodocyclaceae bacterium]|nr:prepilin-type N-terminal cleavage/methylation domain-containing protein [Rhodocyclaceae bacterium]